jgi:hypothetical protein
VLYAEAYGASESSVPPYRPGSALRSLLSFLANHPAFMMNNQSVPPQKRREFCSSGSIDPTTWQFASDAATNGILSSYLELSSSNLILENEQKARLSEG